MDQIDGFKLLYLLLGGYNGAFHLPAVIINDKISTAKIWSLQDCLKPHDIAGQSANAWLC